MSNLKLIVEVMSAHNLVAKDGNGSSNAYVELHFDEQKVRTSTKEKDLNPYWNELFVFDISDSEKIHRLTLDAYVCNQSSEKDSSSFLGKVRLSGSSFVNHSEASVMFYPLEKRDIFSRVKGELGLKVFITDDSSLKPATPLEIPKDESSPKKTRKTFHTLPNSGHLVTPNLMQNSEQIKQQAMEFARQRFDPFGAAPHLNDFSLKETSPHLGGGHVVGGRVIRGSRSRPVGTHDLVEQVKYLFVRVVKSRELPPKDASGSLDPYVEVRVGNYKARTRYFEKTKHPEWNEVFAFASDSLQASMVEVVLKDKNLIKDDFVGRVTFDIYEIPTRVPPDSPLVSEWYRLEDRKGEKKKGELMLAVWFGTQADEAFQDAWHSDAISSSDTNISPLLRSKVYHSPRLWYLRVRIIQAQDLIVNNGRIPEAHVKVQLGNQILRTKTVSSQTMNPVWNEELMFVASEPFDDNLMITVEDRVAANQDESLGIAVIPLNYVDKRLDDRYIRDRWIHLERSVQAAMEEKEMKKNKFHTRLHVLIILDGGYHVLDESTQYSSDLRPSAKPLWKSPVGVLELGILDAVGLLPVKAREGRGSLDSYCVAKYGQKWVRTRTIVDSLAPKYNEQYTWEVYDPATVLTVGVFDNNQAHGLNDHKDTRIGKIRIRLSTLETGRVYTHSYPLLLLQASGLKKMGELHLAIRFSCTSLVNLLYLYSRPLLPKMHYVKPLTMMEQEKLRQQAVMMVAARLGRAEPPLRREVIEYISDTHSHLFSMRRSKANINRLAAVFSGVSTASKWFKSICLWKNPVTSVLVHILFAILVFFPELILPTIFIYMIAIGIWNFIFYRPRYPPHMNIKLSFADLVSPDELDEEFDEFPSKRSHEILRWRYDRLRSVAGRIQTVIGDMATQGERIQALLSWRDSRATLIFLVFCAIAAIVCYIAPLQLLLLGFGMYIMRHPKLRSKTPSPPINFFRRLPARTDSLL